MRAAIPDYLGSCFDQSPPGHRFSLYFPVWEDDWSLAKSKKGQALSQTLSMGGHIPMLDALRARQGRLVETLPADGRLSIYAKSTAPFATGMGMEHPLENGFAFLNPYGLPYLPASGVKGVLRRAAEELALFDESEMTLLDVWWLFGFEGSAGAIWESRGPWRDGFDEHVDTLLQRPDLEGFLNRIGAGEQRDSVEERFQSLRDHCHDLQWRGALTFWDALPKPAGVTLEMEVMTPHYGDYYQHNGTPHDSGQPNPIVFLVVPANSRFTFHLGCDANRLPPGLQGTWKKQIRSAFRHAFDWLGFGAKTAVGYGAMEPDPEAEQSRKIEEKQRRRALEKRRLREEKERMEQERIAKLDPVEQQMEVLIAKNPDRPPVTVLVNALKAGEWQGDTARKAAGFLQQRMEEQGVWREQSNKKKPEKDRPYQQTLAVKAVMNGA